MVDDAITLGCIGILGCLVGICGHDPTDPKLDQGPLILGSRAQREKSTNAQTK